MNDDEEDEIDYIGFIPGEYDAEELYPARNATESKEPFPELVMESEREPISLNKEDYNIQSDDIPSDFKELCQAYIDVISQEEPPDIDELVKSDPREFPMFIPDTSKLRNDQLYMFLNVILNYVSAITKAHMAKQYISVGNEFYIDLTDADLVYNVLWRVYHADKLLSQFTRLSSSKVDILGFDEAHNFQKYRLPRLVRLYRHCIKAFMLKYGYHIKFLIDAEYNRCTMAIKVTYDDSFSEKIFRILHAREFKRIQELINNADYYKNMHEPRHTGDGLTIE